MLAALLLFAQVPRLPRRPPPPPPPPPFSTSINLVIKTAAGEARAAGQPKQAPVEPRPLAVIKVGEKPQIRWLVRNVDPRKAGKKVAVHFLVQRQEAAGAKIPAELQRGSLIDHLMGTELAPKGSTAGSYNTAIYTPGFYLVEIELLDETGKRRQYCVVDLQVVQP